MWPGSPIVISLLVLAIYLVLHVDGVTASEDVSILINEVGRNANQSLLWGPYRPNLYFGVRPRLAKSLMTGLLWSKVDDPQSIQHSMYVSRLKPPPPFSTNKDTSNLANRSC